MKCDICGKEGVRLRKVSETYGKGEDLLVIEDVPMFSCPHCGESYFTAETLHEIENIKTFGHFLPWNGHDIDVSLCAKKGKDVSSRLARDRLSHQNTDISGRTPRPWMD